MAWTAQLTKAEPVAGNANVTITLQFTSDSGEVVTRDIPSDQWSDERIAIWAQSIIVALETRDATLAALKAKIASGPLAITLPRDGFPTPDADAQAAEFVRGARIVALSQLATLQSAASAGVIAADDPDLLAVQSAAKVVDTTTTAKPASP